MASVGKYQPVRQLLVEVDGALEVAAGQEGRLQVAVAPLHQSLGLRVPWPALDHLHHQRTAEGGELLAQDRVPSLPAPHPRLVVPDQGSGHRPQLAEQPPVPSNQIACLAAGQHSRHHPPRVDQHHDQDRHHTQHPRAQRDPLGREPQVALRQLSWLIGRPRRRVGRQIHPTQLTHSLLEHGQAARPADALGDHRRRHVRRLP